MTERELGLIEALSNAKAPSGFEDEVVGIMRGALSDVCVCEEDALRNLIIRRKADKGEKPVLMLDAHSDEVGFMVQAIRPEGTLRVVALGGWNRAALPGTRVMVRNRFGRWIPVCIASKPPHFMSAAERERCGMPEIRSLAVDIGATSPKEAEEAFGIRIGEPIVPATRFLHDPQQGLLFGKAFDCRIGCAALAEVMRRLADEPLGVNLVGCLSAQEEVGERGCKVAVNRIRPDAAIVLEGCPADDTFGESYAMQTRLKRGPMLRFMDVTVICNPRFQRHVLDLAEARSLMVQASVREGGGNDAAAIQSLLDGAPSVVMGVPVRYIHGPECITSCQDYEATVALTVEVIRSLDAGIIRAF
ncbi:MAG: M20/M25/M40 family metallo-hydrolase [Kiritimatiellae bacterium]|nr:M20/M25/M40 family metallo-hydrolase [Kiritimatiellia bacterium]